MILTLTIRKCFKCYDFGHIASDCSNRKVISFTKQEAVEEGLGEDPMVEATEEEYHLLADEGELLVV